MGWGRVDTVLWDVGLEAGQSCRLWGHLLAMGKGILLQP